MLFDELLEWVHEKVSMKGAFGQLFALPITVIDYSFSEIQKLQKSALCPLFPLGKFMQNLRIARATTLRSSFHSYIKLLITTIAIVSKPNSEGTVVSWKFFAIHHEH